MSYPTPNWRRAHDIFLCAHDRANTPLPQITRLLKQNFPKLRIYAISTAALERRMSVLELGDNDYWTRDVRREAWARGLNSETSASGGTSRSRVYLEADAEGESSVGEGEAENSKRKEKMAARRATESYYGVSGGGFGAGDGDVGQVWVQENEVQRADQQVPLGGDIHNSQARALLSRQGNIMEPPTKHGELGDLMESARKADEYILALNSTGAHH